MNHIHIWQVHVLFILTKNPTWLLITVNAIPHRRSQNNHADHNSIHKTKEQTALCGTALIGIGIDEGILDYDMLQ